jgi:hypothetical protein
MSNYGVCYDGENGGLLKVTWKGDIEKRYIMVFIQRQLKEIIDICLSMQNLHSHCLKAISNPSIVHLQHKVELALHHFN